MQVKVQILDYLMFCPLGDSLSNFLEIIINFMSKTNKIHIDKSHTIITG